MGIDIQDCRCLLEKIIFGFIPEGKPMVVCGDTYGISAISADHINRILLIIAGVEPNPGPTGTHERNNPLCKNWNRVAYGYRYVKTGLTGFIFGQIGRRYNFLKVKVDEQYDDVKPCSGCTTSTLLPDHGTFGCNQKEKCDCLCQHDPVRRKKCPNNFCGHFYHLIVDDHVKNSPLWSNIDMTKWYEEHFQYAKCFLGTDTSASSLSDLDCADLLTIVINNKHIHNCSIKEVESFQQCLKDQDIIFQPGNFEVTDSELYDYFDHMIHVLEDGKCLFKDPNAMQAVKELHKLKDDLMILSDEDIDGLLQKTSDTTFVFRYQYLLIEIGTQVIRKLLDDKVGPNFGYYLRHNRDEKNQSLLDKLQDLIKKKCITAAQTRYLPPMDSNPSSTNFDISLLTCLLRNVCGMRPAEDPVWTNPFGHSVEADITRLKECRNNLSHSGTVFISNTVFTTIWNELCEILKRLNQGLKESCRITNLQNLIDECKNHCIDENKMEGFTKEINAWKKMNPDFIAHLERHDQGINRRLDHLDHSLERLEKHIEKLTVKLTAEAATQTASTNAQSLILDAAENYSCDGQEQTCNTEVQTAFNGLASDMKDKGVDIDSVKEGSILITFRCSTRSDLERLRQYITDEMYEEKLAVLENAVSKCIKCPVKLNISIVPEHTASALMQTDKATSKKSVVLTLKYEGSEGVRNALGFLMNGSSTKSMKKLSDALSRSVGEEITLHTTVVNNKLDSDMNELSDQPSPEENIKHQDEQYIFRYQYLLIKLGTEVLRKVFDVVVGSNVVQYLTVKSQDIQSLIKTRVITADQKQYLPPIDNQPDSSNFDITLLSCLLRNICGLRQPMDPVWIKPAIEDTSTEANITRLRICKNQLMHSDKLVLPEADLESKWQDLSVILLHLNNVAGIAQLQSDINNAKIMDIDEKLREQLDKTIKAWHESDRQQRIDEVGSEVGNVKQDTVGVVSEVSYVKQDIVDVVSEVGNGKQDIFIVVSEVGNVKQDIVGGGSEVGNVKQDIVGCGIEVENFSIRKLFYQIENKEPKPWRSFPESGESLERSIVFDSRILRPLENPAILIVGPFGAGKSSFINSCLSVGNGRKKALAKTGSADTIVNKNTDSGLLKNFRFLDCMGIEAQFGYEFYPNEIFFLLQGHVKKNYKFDPKKPLTTDSEFYEPNPQLKDKIHCVVFVDDAQAMHAGIPLEYVGKIKWLQEKIKEADVPRVLILTKADKLCEKVKENTSNIFSSIAVQEAVKFASKIFSIEMDSIHPVVNSSEHFHLTAGQNIPILLALRQIMHYASDRAEQVL